MRHKPALFECSLALLILTFFIRIAVPAEPKYANPVPFVGNTVLDVRLSGGQPQWGNSRTLHALHTITFRWKTDVPNTAYGEWQLLDYKPQPNGMNETPFAKASVALPPSGQFQEFTIDFVQLQQQNPSKIPANAPAAGKDYWIRMVPWTAGGGAVAGQISAAIKLTYVKASTPPPAPLTLNYVAEFWIGGHYVDIGYGANHPVAPLITISTSAPVKDANGNPVFDKQAKIVSSSIPFLSGYEDNGEVELRNLTPKTHYHYIVEAKDEKGQKAYKAGQFTTAKRFVEVAYEKIFMIDDSDGFPSGAGDMNFSFFVNNENIQGPNKMTPEHNTMVFSTGQTKTFNVFKTLEDPPDKLNLRVNGSDQDDCGDVIHHPLCNCGPGGGEGSIITDPKMKNHTCSDGSAELSAATTMMNVPDVTDRSEFGIEFFQKSFSMTGDNGHLKFRVSGSMSVRYH
jgi:hypothetical protein